MGSFLRVQAIIEAEDNPTSLVVDRKQELVFSWPLGNESNLGACFEDSTEERSQLGRVFLDQRGDVNDTNGGPQQRQRAADGSIR